MHAMLLATLMLSLGSVAESGGQDVTGVAASAAQPTIEQQLAEASALLDRSRYNEAIEIFDRVLVRIPDFGPALAGRAAANAWTNRLDEATRDVDAAARSMPDAAVIHRVRAIIAQRRSDDTTAIAEYSRSLELEPGQPFALRIRAYLYQRAGNHAAALADAETLIGAFPHEPESYVLKADLLIGQRARPQAAAEAERLIRLFPQDPSGLVAAARIYDSLSDRSRALAAIDRAVALDPDSYSYLALRGGFRRWDDFAGRRADFAAALALDPGNTSIITQLALVDFKERRWRDAIARFSTVLADEPNDYGLLTYRAMAHLNAGDRAAAERDYRAATTVSAGADDFNLLCASFGREGFALDWGMEACNRAVTANASESSYRISRGLIALRQGRLDAALADYDAAIAADRRRADGFYGRALVHHRKGSSREAQADRAEALAIDPGIAEAFQSYGFTDF